MVSRTILAVALLAFGLVTQVAAADSHVDFESQVRPLLAQACVKCHGPDKQNGGLRFDLRQAAFAAGDSGSAAIVAGDAAGSELVRRIESADETVRMPADAEPLAAAEIALLKDWIAQGAVWPEESAPADVASEMRVTDRDREHWAFRRLAPAIPFPESESSQADWRTPIDHFLGAALAAKGIEPNGPADGRTLIRRLSFDLLGSPPSPEEVEEFLADERPDAYEKLVDRLLDDPRYGERWGRHWLDVARYADSDGMETDADRPYAYPYRDFVIQSLNEDLPYDTFVRWQIAGDEYEPDNVRALAATGFLTAALSCELDVPMEEEKLRLRYNELDDMAVTTVSAFLSLTLGCARCHDHKFDAIPTRDYYRIQCAFTTTARDEIVLDTRHAAAEYRERKSVWEAEQRPAREKLDSWLEGQRQSLKDRLKKEQVDDEELLDNLSDEQRARHDELRSELEAIEQRRPADPAFALAIVDTKSEPEPTFLLTRGDFYSKQEKLDVGFLTVLTGERRPEDYWSAAKEALSSGDGTPATTGQRRALADWITDVDQGAGPLLARVIVNRVWQHHFGEGLVRTMGDFGVRGEAPSHPELLEWLAGELVAGGWRLKPLHREIISSAAYRRSTSFDEQRGEIDPENRLLWRRRPLRIESEVLRDAILQVSGVLNDERFGPAFKPPIPSEAIQARNAKDPYPQDVVDSPATRRRTIYMFHKRVVQHPFMQAFDGPDASVTCARRSITTVAPQALALLNDRFVRDRAKDFADRLLAETNAEPSELVERGFRLAVSRSPNENEKAASISFVERQLQRHEASRDAVADFCQTLFGLNEFMYVD